MKITKKITVFFIIFFLFLSFSPNFLFAEEDLDDEFFSELEEEYVLEKNTSKPITSVNDPFQKFNRAMFAFNDKLYIYVLDPVGKGYTKVTPKSVRKGIGNFFTNLFKPISILNSILQFEFKDAGKQTASFFLNSTLGILGIFDIAKDFPSLKKSRENFGKTLGKYGVGDGFYIVFPFLGPTTLRDTAGMTFDYYISYQQYLKDVDSDVTFGMRLLKQVNDMGPKMTQYKELKKMAVDPYIAVRNAYIQNRNNRID